MPDEAPTCQECGVELEGRDVYEGMCRSCREDMILGEKLPARRRKDTVSQQVEPSSALPASVTMDEDTKEMDAVQTPASAAEEPPGPAPLAAQEHPATTAEPPVLAFDATPPVAPAALSTDQEDLVPSIVVPSAEEPPLEGAAVEPDTDALDADDEGLLALQLPAQGEEPPRGLSVEELRLETDSAPSPAPAEASPPKQVEPQPPEAATGAEESPAAPASLRFADSGTAAQAQANEDFPEENIRRALDRLGKQVDELAAELERVRGGGRAAAQQIALGFRLCVGFVLGLGLLGVLVVGGMYVVGKFLHPPTLELLERALRAITG